MRSQATSGKLLTIQTTLPILLSLLTKSTNAIPVPKHTLQYQTTYTRPQIAKSQTESTIFNIHTTTVGDEMCCKLRTSVFPSNYLQQFKVGVCTVRLLALTVSVTEVIG
ncbi:hypothetical protein HanXRQr2_Chr17g0789051 [Helianthus annuus]|uniref:Secreted protein n=1 Tax=Helianthus annuus TaxID=4232 RepID=A0A9K3DF81_HELAN|nr:hypothetical protein HanXRQr2_Chr17g0789051 [Helianthus annuus]KAJ0812014.1 hypothetical protein HanPSC8_Chr17g0757171 [Helianthus annuus]